MKLTSCCWCGRWMLGLVVLSLLIWPVMVIGSEVIYGGEIVIAQPTEPQNLDPQRDAGGPSSEIQASVLETLVSFDNEMQLEPCLATGWIVSEDGTEYTFFLRQGVKFHDGTDLDADAVKYTFDRSLGKIDGNINRYASLITGLQSIEVVDASTVKMTLDTPFAPFLNVLAHTGFSILSPTALETQASTFSQQPIGTGPFRVVKWTKGQQIVLEKFADYWKEGQPYLDRIVFRILPDAQTRVAAIKAGEVDFVILLPENMISVVEASSGLHVVETPTLRTVFYRFNPTKPPFDDINIRKAFVHSIDTELLVSTILEGHHFLATQPTQPLGVYGISDEIEPYEYNPDLAAECLKASGWAQGADGRWTRDGKPLQFTLWTTTNRYPQDSTLSVAVKTLLCQQGMDVDVQTMEWGAYRDAIFGREFGVHLFGAGCSTGDVDYIYTLLFSGSGGSMYAQGPSAADEVIDQARATVDVDERLELSREFQTIIRNEYLWFPIYWMSQLLGISDAVHGFAARPDENLCFDTVWIER